MRILKYIDFTKLFNAVYSDVQATVDSKLLRDSWYALNFNDFPLIAEYGELDKKNKLLRWIKDALAEDYYQAFEEEDGRFIIIGNSRGYDYYEDASKSE